MVSWKSRLATAPRRKVGRGFTAAPAVLAVSAILAVVAGPSRPTAAAAADGPQFLERAPLVIPLDRLRGDAGKAGWAVEVVNLLPDQPIDTELRVVGPVAGWVSVRSPATIRIAPGAVATFRVVRRGPPRVGSGELVAIAGGALDRRAITITRPPKGLVARWLPRLLGPLILALPVGLLALLLLRSGRSPQGWSRRGRSDTDTPEVPAGPAVPEMPQGPAPLRVAESDGSGPAGPPPAPGLLYNDEPATVDQLDRKQYADELARLAREAQPPLVIGVFGEWGSGKTSLLRQVREQLKSDQTSAVAWFDPWKHQFDENPVLPLLHAVVRDLNLESREDIRRTLQVISEALGSLVLSTTSQLTVADLRSSIRSYDEENFRLRSERTRLDEYFSGLVTHALKDRGRARLVVFIDDLDRCLPDQILALLEALKLYLNRTDCIFFLAVDSQHLVQVVAGKYKDVGIDGADYLEKIVQMPFHMPRLSPSAFEDYLDMLLPDDLKATAQVLGIGLRPNPRAVKRFVNMLRLQDLLARNRGVNPYDVKVLAAVLLIRSTMPEFYTRLEGDSTLLVRVAEDVETAQEGAVPDWDEQVVRLVKVLAGSAQGVPTDVAAYIDLAAAARPQEGPAEQGIVVTPSMLRELLTQQAPDARLALRGARFARGEDFSRMHLAEADLSMAQLAETRLEGTDLSRALLTGANLSGADLTSANLNGADLTSANLNGAIVTGADLRRATLQGALLAGVNLSQALTEDAAVRSDAAAPPSMQEPPTPLSKTELQTARATLAKRVGEGLSQLPASKDLVDLGLLVRSDFSELTDAYRPSVDVDREPTPLRSSQLHEFFEKTNQELLILGHPGFGKTTLALRLMDKLLRQADQDPQAPVPVLLRIASWSGPGQLSSAGRLGDWLAEELSRRYGISLMAASTLIDRGGLISVLDGLDELPPEQRARFIDLTRVFIDISRKRHGSARMVITTRQAGAQDLAIRLGLRGAVELQPLDQAAASEYLQRHARTEEESDRLREFVEANPAFTLNSPLMLQILMSTFEAQGALPTSPDELIDQFAHAQLVKLAQKGQFDRAMAEKWLRALAKHLSREQQWVIVSDDPKIRSALRQVGLRGREVPAFLRAAAEQGLLREIRENEYMFTHLLLQEYFSAP
jgi:hypothetical protein